MTTPGANLNVGRGNNPAANLPNLGQNRPPLNANGLGNNAANLNRNLNRTLNNSVGQSLNNLPGSRTTNFRPGLNNLGNVAGRAPLATSVRLGNRSINFASNNYRPSFSRYPWYHGYWNGGRYPGAGFGVGYGRGLGYGGYGGYGYGGYGGYGRYGYGYGSPWFGGYYGGYGNYFPLGWGLGGWGLGSLLYGSGYLPYSNPYYGGGYGGGGYTVYDYSQPIPVAYADNSQVIDPSASQPLDDGGAASQPTGLDGAISAFRNGNYDQSLDLVNKEIQRNPSDAVLHEFRALVLFARKDYQQAASTIHSVLAVGPGWDWTTLSSLYTDVDLYTQQLRDLESYTVAHPDDAASAFLLGYHYLSDGHPDAAAREFQTVTKLQPSDQVASDLLKMLTSQTQQAATDGKVPAPNAPNQGLPPAAPPQQQAAPPAQGTQGGDTQVAEADPFQPTGPAVDAAMLAGSWSAARNDGSQFHLQLTPDSKFTWTFQNKQSPTPQKFDGTYTLKGNVLALERKEGGSMVGELTSTDSRKFHFKLYGSPDTDPGLDFTK